MAEWKKEKIEIDGKMVDVQMPVIVSASRSTDIPAFYPDWFMERLRVGYVKWINPFNGAPLHVGFRRMRCIVFWSKNPAPICARLDELDTICPNYYFQFTLNDYDDEKIEPNVPPLEARVETFRRLSERIGRDRVIWRFDPLILSDRLSVNDLLERVERLGDRIAPYTSRLVFSFIDIHAYRKVCGNLKTGGIHAREFMPDEMCTVAQGIGTLAKNWKIAAATCGETADLDRYGIEHNRCIDDRLLVKCFSHDRELMDFIGYDPQGELFDTCPDAEYATAERMRHAKWKDRGQRKACGCILSKDVGEYDTCPHLCHYCYANTNNAAVTANWNRHRVCPHADTITGIGMETDDHANQGMK